MFKKAGTWYDYKAVLHTSNFLAIMGLHKNYMHYDGLFKILGEERRKKQRKSGALW